MLRIFSAAIAGAAILAAVTPALAAPSASGEPEPGFRPNVRAALAVGALTMLIPGVIGGFRTAYGASDGDKTAGLLLASGGFTLAPIFSHMVVHEWDRAAKFGVIPILSSIGAIGLISQYPTAVYHGTMATRTAFGVLLGVGMLDAVLGLADTALAGERARERQRPGRSGLVVMPAVGQHGATLTIGGAL